MKKDSIVTSSLLLFLFMFLANIIHSQPADSPWPMFMHDARHTGRSAFAGPDSAYFAWEFNNPETNVAGVQDPVIGNDGTIYFGSGKTFNALNPDGSIRWLFKPEGTYIIGAAAIDKNGKIYFCSSGYGLYILNNDGSLNSKYETVSLRGSPTIGNDGTIFIGSYDNNFYAFNPDGSLKWIYQSEYSSNSEAAISNDSTIYFCSSNLFPPPKRSRLIALKPDGNMKWKYDFFGFNAASGSPSIGADGTICVANEGGTLYALNPDGRKKWEYGFDWHSIIRSTPTIGKEGTIYLGAEFNLFNGIFYALNPNGTLKWKKQITNEEINSSATLDCNGIIYFSTSMGTLYAMNPDSTLKWTFKRGIEGSSAVAGPGGTLYYSTRGKLVAFFSPGKENSDLFITSSEIEFNPPKAVMRGKNVEIKVTVHELNNKTNATFDVVFYYQNTDHQIARVHGYVLAGTTNTIKAIWNTEGVAKGTYPIIVKIENAFPAETNVSNNEATAQYILEPNIQDQIDAAQVGDTVWVAPGTYYENLTLKKGVVVKSIHGPEQTIIDGREKNSVIKALHLDPTAVIEGFTLTNGYQSTFGGGGIYIERGGITIRNNIICGNRASNGGAIWMIGSFVESDPVIENNLIINNHASFDGGAVYANNSWALFRNNTVVNNRSSFSDKTGGIHTVGYYSPSAGIVNCIIWGNGINLGGTASAIYSCIEKGSSGTGNIFVDPRFVNPANGDYGLQPDSPCIDAGDPGSRRDPDGTRADMGWKYYDQSATIALIMGRLTDITTGAPVTMAKIFLSGPRNDLVPPDAKGNYVFAVPADTGYCVSVFAPNHASAKRERISATIGEATIIDFSLTPYPTQITLYPPSELKGTYGVGKVHLTWQRPMDEQAFDDGFYEAAVGFKNSQGILAAGPFKPTNYPAKIEKIKVAFDGERAGDKIELLVSLDNSGTATKPASSMLVFNQPNIPIEVGGGFQEIDVSNEGLTLNNGAFFIGIKQVNIKPMYMLLDQSSADGHAFVDDNLDGIFESLASSNIHGALAIRTIVSMPTTGSPGSLINKIILPATNTAINDSIRLMAVEKKLPTGLISKSIVASKSSRILDEEKNAVSLLAETPQGLAIFRSTTSPVQLSTANKIATLAASSTYYDDINLGSSEGYYYVVAVKYSDGTVVPSEEISVSISTEIGEATTIMIPDRFELSQNNPNPFNPETTIKYQLPEPSKVAIRIFNITGQVVKTIFEEHRPAGYHSILWDGKDDLGNNVSSGVYLYQLCAKIASFGEAYTETRKMVLVR